METYHMIDPTSSIPDLTSIKTSKNEKNICEHLFQDITDVIKGDEFFWTTHYDKSAVNYTEQQERQKRLGNKKKFFGNETNIDQGEDSAVLFGKIMQSLIKTNSKSKNPVDEE